MSSCRNDVMKNDLFWLVNVLDQNMFSDGFLTGKRQTHACSSSIFKYGLYNYMNKSKCKSRTRAVRAVQFQM